MNVTLSKIEVLNIVTTANILQYISISMNTLCILNVFNIICQTFSIKNKNKLKRRFLRCLLCLLGGFMCPYPGVGWLGSWGSWQSATLMCQSKFSLQKTYLHFWKVTFVTGCLYADSCLFVGGSEKNVMCSWLHAHFTANHHYLTFLFSVILPFFLCVCGVYT